MSIKKQLLGYKNKVFEVRGDLVGYCSSNNIGEPVRRYVFGYSRISDLGENGCFAEDIGYWVNYDSLLPTDKVRVSRCSQIEVYLTDKQLARYKKGSLRWQDIKSERNIAIKAVKSIVNSDIKLDKEFRKIAKRSDFTEIVKDTNDRLAPTRIFMLLMTDGVIKKCWLNFTKSLNFVFDYEEFVWECVSLLWQRICCVEV